jgi:pyruvate formate lyase activating enzyme
VVSALRIGGLTPFSATDYPGRLAAVAFCQGCPWRCGYCHNPHLLEAGAAASMPWNAVLAFLERRRGLLGAVVFSGGEPTLQSGLPAAIHSVRDMGYRVGLHTGGMYPDRLAAVLPGVDWVGLDVKATFEGYDAITGVTESGVKVRESLRLLLDDGTDHECRTTWHPTLYPEARLHALADELATAGVRNWALQICRPTGKTGDLRALASDELDACGRLGSRFPGFSLRNT